MGAFQDKEKLLKDAGIEVVLHNNDQHFICSKSGVIVDYWPKNDTYIERSTKLRNTGIKHLIAFFNSVAPHQKPQQLNSEGMTLRDYFAAKAMQGLVVDAVIDVDAIASMSYRIASAMMKERAVNHG